MCGRAGPRRQMRGPHSRVLLLLRLWPSPRMTKTTAAERMVFWGGARSQCGNTGATCPPAPEVLRGRDCPKRRRVGGAPREPVPTSVQRPIKALRRLDKLKVTGLASPGRMALRRVPPRLSLANQSLKKERFLKMRRGRGSMRSPRERRRRVPGAPRNLLGRGAPPAGGARWSPAYRGRETFSDEPLARMGRGVFSTLPKQI